MIFTKVDGTKKPMSCLIVQREGRLQRGHAGVTADCRVAADWVVKKP